MTEDISNVINMYKNQKLQNRKTPLGYKNNKNQHHQIFQKPPKNAFIPIRNLSDKKAFQMDLIDMSKFSRKNRGYKWIFNIIDLDSRFVFSIPLKNKMAKSTLEAFKTIPVHIIDELGFITADEGKEFMGGWKNYLKQHNIQIHRKNPTNKTTSSVVERMNLTYWNFIKKIMEITGDNWIDYHDEIIRKYNNSPHSTLEDVTKGGHKGLSPQQALDTNHKIIIPMTDFEKNTSNEILEDTGIQIGSRVRHQIIHSQFTKRSFANNYSRTIYKVAKIHNNRYTLNNRKSYLRRELILAGPAQKDMVTQPRTEANKIRRVRRLNDFKQKDAEILYINEDGSPVYKERLRPKNKKRVRKLANHIE